MSDYTNTMSASALADLTKVITRWTAEDLDVAKAIRVESKDYRTYAEKSFARVVGAAYATAAAYAADMVGKGKTFDGTQGLADAFGLSSKGNITRFAALGKILTIAKVDPMSDLYATVQTKNLHAAEHLKAVLKGDTFTEQDVADAVALDLAAKDAKAAKPTLTADEKAAAKKQAVEDAKRDALAAMLPQDALDLIVDMVKNLLKDERVRPQHVNALERRVNAEIGKFRTLGADTSAA